MSYLYMVSLLGSSPFGLQVHALVWSGREECACVLDPNWLSNVLVVCLCGFGQSFPS